MTAGALTRKGEDPDGGYHVGRLLLLIAGPGNVQRAVHCDAH